jgi:hypothetical protein
LAALGPLPAGAPQNYLTGFVTSNVGLSTKLAVGAGQAMDSLNLQFLNLPSGCPRAIDLVKNGANGLDTGTVQDNTQYDFFALAQGSYGGPPTCIATLGTNAAPQFALAFPPPLSCGGPPQYAVALSVQVNLNSLVVFNVTSTAPVGALLLNPLAGLAVGDSVLDCSDNSYISSGSTIASLAPIYTGFTADVSNNGNNTSILTNISPQTAVNSMVLGETIGNAQGVRNIQPGTVITAIILQSGGNCSSPPCVVISPAAQSGTGLTLGASTNSTIQLNQATNNNCASPPCTDTIYVYNDRYRLLASLHTDPNDTNLVPFTQNGDTFYLDTPAADVNVTVGLPPAPMTLPSVPSGPGVEAFGRCVVSAKVHIFTPGLSPAAPLSFPIPPGYDTQTTTGSGTGTTTSFPFRVYTNGAHQIEASASTPGTTLQCMTDGWVLHPSS